MKLHYKLMTVLLLKKVIFKLGFNCYGNDVHLSCNLWKPLLLQTISKVILLSNTIVFYFIDIVYEPTTEQEGHRDVCKQGPCVIIEERKLREMIDDSEYIKLEGIDDREEMSLRLSLLDSRNSRRISDNSTVESSLQKSINDTVEANPCKRIGLHQVGKTKILLIEEKPICYLRRN